MKAIRAIALFTAVHAASCLAAAPSSVTISENSIRIHGVELRTGPQASTGKSISLSAAEKVLGPPQDNYVAGLGLHVYAWRDAGIHVQRGFRGPENGKILKFQVWFVNDYDRAEDKHTGKFTSVVDVEGIDIEPDTTFDSIRDALQKAGFEITENADVTIAKKGDISIFTVETTNKIQRVEAWCT